ncbi:MAG: hypothetical protein AAFR87_31455 [Bacteroidota bacterium]
MNSIEAKYTRHLKALCLSIFLLGILSFSPQVYAFDTPDKIDTILQGNEDEYWEKTKSIHTEDAYRKYILLSNQGKYTGKYLSDASRAIQDIWDDKAWARAKEKATVSAYEEYLASNSEGKYREEALKKIGTSPKTRSAKPASKGVRPPAKVAVRKTKPVEKVKIAAKEKPAESVEIDLSQIPLMYEDSVWNSTINWDSETSYKNYLDQFPQGRYVEEALKKIPIEVSFVRNQQGQGRSIFNLSYGMNPVIISKISLRSDNGDKDKSAFELAKDVLKTENLQGDSVYTYSIKDMGVNVRMDMPAPLDAKVVMLANRANAYKIEFRDALGRTTEIALDPASDEFKVEYISGYGVGEDTLYFKLSGGSPDYTVQFFELDRYVVRHEVTLRNDHGKIDTDLWYIDKIQEAEIAELSGDYYLTLFDAGKAHRIEHNRIIHFSTGFFGNIENLVLILIIFLFVALGIGWGYVKLKEKRQPKFKPIS